MKRLLLLILFFQGELILGQSASVPHLLPKALEIELAQSALPKYLQADATVYVLKRGKGFVMAKAGNNGYTCFVQRNASVPEAVIPIAFDAEGMRVMVPPMFDKMKMIESGMTVAEADANINKGFKNGQYLPPVRGGMSYMLSPLNILPNPRGTGTFKYYPHYMVYAPFTTNKDIGVSQIDLKGWLPFVNETGPHGKIVIPLGEKERNEVEAQHAGLIKRYNEYKAGSAKSHE